MTKNQIKFAREVLDEYPSEKEVYSFADGNVFLSGAKTHALNHVRSTGKQFSLIRRDEIEALEAAAEAAEKAATEAAEKAAAEAAEKAAAEAAEKERIDKALKTAAEKALKAAAEKEAVEKAKKSAFEKAEKEAAKKAKKADKGTETAQNNEPESVETEESNDTINHID